MWSYKLPFGKHAKFFGIKSMNLFPAPLTHFSYLEVGVLSGMPSKLLHHHPPTPKIGDHLPYGITE